MVPLPKGQLDQQTTFLLLHDRRIVFDGTTEELVHSTDPFIRNYLE
jgi:phospholipid/cholesterol/gamma-HCH transport system ATP-binding protein